MPNENFRSHFQEFLQFGCKFDALLIKYHLNSCQKPWGLTKYKTHPHFLGILTQLYKPAEERVDFFRGGHAEMYAKSCKKYTQKC